MNARAIPPWAPDDPAFWQARGKLVAHRNLWIAVPNLLVAFAVWMLWSVVVVMLPAAGFPFSTTQLFLLVAMPGLSGALLRVVYGLAATRVEGRRLTLVTTLVLLLPAVGLGLAVQHPQTPYPLMLVLAALCGLGAGSFASSMTSLTLLFPRWELGSALGLNSGMGNLGVSMAQFLVPIVIAWSVFGALAGPPQAVELRGDWHPLWLQNAGFIWVPVILLCALFARFGMHEVPFPKARETDAPPVYAQRRYWVLSLMYLGTFGSFIGFTAAFPLFAHTQFPQVDVLQYAFLGPLLGALARPLGGWLADRYGGGPVTFCAFAVMGASVLASLGFLPGPDADGRFWGLMATFMVLFMAAGLGSGSMFRIVPELIEGDQPEPAPRRSIRESGQVIGLVSAIGALGAFAVPVVLALALAAWGAVGPALLMFVLFYLVCMAATWWCHVRTRSDPDW
ncbi:MFS transporter [Thioalkalivibrio paradoxus]|uniref:Nitrate transporter n=1 Tax=Thioalkalivibrio paradoxus ARh 1 TaxID=713585 RepID=W0DLY2_9GAMM|nr:MFS transporter [Thioalkalivibrio paradoxus]AHE98247.1 nitrate transporter [Thioalkalivibrio paradoxus ARh 1]